ncbi:MAG: hypothetical protein CMJ77_09205 [Planctomycetaceae bacterium]|nr:hypothetical protein [Planctomycetaceae bacterium]
MKKLIIRLIKQHRNIVIPFTLREGKKAQAGTARAYTGESLQNTSSFCLGSCRRLKNRLFCHQHYVFWNHLNHVRQQRTLRYSVTKPEQGREQETQDVNPGELLASSFAAMGLSLITIRNKKRCGKRDGKDDCDW